MIDQDSPPSALSGVQTAPFRVGDWLAEPAWNRLTRGGAVVKLEPLVMRLLVTIAAAPGRPLSRQQLLDAVWPDTIVNEEALSRAVSQLRRALNDDPKAPRYVQTVHKGGYCLIAPVAEALPRATTPPLKTEAVRRGWLLLVAGLAGALLSWLALRPDQPPALAPLAPITSDPGREIDPAVSPDGRRVAYLASVDGGYDVFVRDMDGAAPLRVTRSPLSKGHLAWSPRSDRIAFVGASGAAAAIYVVPATGGEPVRIMGLPAWSYGLDWSPDGRTIAFSDAAPGETAGIAVLDIASGTARPIARSDSSAGDVKPAFSPDGKRLAFLRNDQTDRQRIAVVRLEPGEADTVLLGSPRDIRGFDWVPDGASLIFSADSGRRFGLWRVKAEAQAQAAAYSVDSGDVYNPSISRTGRIVVEEVEQDRDVWRADLPGGAASLLIRSTAGDYDAVFAPGGRRLAFVSERSGDPEIWMHGLSREAQRLTRLRSDAVRNISWSIDGARLAFVAERNGRASIYAAPAAGGDPLLLLGNANGSVPIGWAAARDGLFVLAPHSGHWRLELFDLSERQRRPIVTPGLRLAAVAADGRSVFAVPARSNILLQIVPARGPVRQLRLPAMTGLAALLPTADAVYLVEKASGPALVHRLDLRSGAVRTVARIEDYSGGALSLAADGRSLAYTRARETANDLAWTELR
jgi:Tol biopolymer transport system component/DNA-binding winged helix-turn-helix (wHTH) protein